MGHLRARLLIREAIGLMVERMPISEPEDPLGDPTMRNKDRDRRGSTNTKKVARDDPAALGHKKQSVGLVYNQVLPWPASVKKIAYDDASERKSGIGPGERRLAKLLGGEVMGGGESYDVVDREGNKWEVKEPTGGLKGEIRPGTEGLAAVQVAFSKIKHVIEQIDGVFGSKKRVKTAAAAEKVMDSATVKKIQEFVTSEAPMLMKGEVSKGRMAKLLEILHLISAVLGDKEPSNDEAKPKHVEMGDEETKVEKDVDLNTYVKLGKVMNLDAKDLNVTPGDMLRSSFSGRAFRDPDAFMEKSWNKAALASDVFGHTSGVILVSDVSFRIVPRVELDKVLVFSRITKGFPHFKVLG